MIGILSMVAFVVFVINSGPPTTVLAAVPFVAFVGNSPPPGTSSTKPCSGSNEVFFVGLKNSFTAVVLSGLNDDDETTY